MTSPNITYTYTKQITKAQKANMNYEKSRNEKNTIQQKQKQSQICKLCF